MSKRALVLELLRSAGEVGVTTAQLLAAGAGARYGGRIFELRELGHSIETTRIREGAFRYVLRSPEPPAVPPTVAAKATEQQQLFDEAA